IPKSKRKEIFQPGYTTKARGWGLGLSLCKRIIEEYHGGRIEVGDGLTLGTTFHIFTN
ncbi:MAG: ATP-binding protein, partial [Bacteroidetes bacterium]|nr:ATP-binding protein [Bacteroidota bacterium]